MSNADPNGSYVPSGEFTRDDWDDVSDNPEWTDEDFRNARPFAEVFPELAEKLRHLPGRLNAPTKQLVSLRLDRDVLERFKSSGPGWQTRMNEVLRRATGDLT